MRTVSIILALQIFLSLSLEAQTISGTVKNTTGAAVSGATVSLLRAADSAVVKLQVSGNDGSFLFTAADTGRYLLSASSVGYRTAFSPLLQGGNGSQVVNLLLSEAATGMTAVVVSAKKPMIQVKGDRMVLNVEGTINATGSTVLELLRKAPSVTVSSEDRISMGGKNGVQVFIDGRPTPLAGADLAAYLKSVQSSDVEAIELITHPSAKYEAAGNAGIINIRLKKNKAFGTNGSVTAGYNQGIYGKSNGSLSLNHRTAKWNLFGNLGYNGGITQKAMTMNRRLVDSAFNQFGVMKDNSQTVNLKLGADWFLNREHTVGLLINGNFSQSALTNDSYTTIAPLASRPTRILRADNRYASARDHLHVNLNHLWSGKEGKTFSFNADYGFYNLQGSQLQPNFYYDGEGKTLLNTITYEMITPTQIDIFSAKGDYEQPFGGGKLGTGVKTSYVVTDNDFQRYNLAQAGKALDYDRSNRFAYREAIHAAYLNWSRQWKTFQLQAGLRAEGTVIRGKSSGKKEGGGAYGTTDSLFRQVYPGLFPSLSVNYSKDPAHQFSLSVSRRIDRPDYQDLNPFELKIDDYIFQRGNAYLRPQYTTGVGVGYVFMQKLNTSLDYSYVKDIASWLVDTAEGSKSLISKRNLAAQKLLSLNVSYPLQYKAYSLFANMNANYTAFTGDFGAGRTLDEKGFGMNLHLQNSLKFAKKWTAELTGLYSSPSLQEGNMRARSFWTVDAGVQTKVLQDRATVKLSVSDVFNTLNFSSTSLFAGQRVDYTTKLETRQVKLSFAFRFGSQEVKAARQRKAGAEEEMKRVH